MTGTWKMGLKLWIQQNLGADATVAWALANSGKFVVEISLAALTVVPLFAIVYLAILFTEGSFPFGAAGPVGLYLLLAAGGYREFWNCRLGSGGQ